MWRNIISASQYILLGMDARSNIHCFYGRKFAIISTVMVPLAVLTPRLVDASPYSSGYSHGCDDVNLDFTNTSILRKWNRLLDSRFYAGI